MTAPCQLYRNLGNGSFEELAVAKNIDVKDFINACSWGDINNDGYADLYLSSVIGSNYLFLNGGPESNFSFSNISSQAGTTAPQKSFPCWFFDFNQDGWQDIFVSGFDFAQFQTVLERLLKIIWD